jgi:protein TonB
MPVPANFKGVTELSFHIQPDGSVKDVVIAKPSGIDALDQSAVECASLWQYKPAMQNGQPIEVSWRVRIPWILRGRRVQ